MSLSCAVTFSHSKDWGCSTYIPGLNDWAFVSIGKTCRPYYNSMDTCVVRIIKLYFNKNLVGDCDLVKTTSFLSDVLTGSISEVPSRVTAPHMSHIYALMPTVEQTPCQHWLSLVQHCFASNALNALLELATLTSYFVDQNISYLCLSLPDFFLFAPSCCTYPSMLILVGITLASQSYTISQAIFWTTTLVCYSLITFSLVLSAAHTCIHRLLISVGITLAAQFYAISWTPIVVSFLRW